MGLSLLDTGLWVNFGISESKFFIPNRYSNEKAMKPEYEQLFEMLGIYAISLIILLLIIRPLNLWYWKVNERLDNQKEQNRLLRKIAGEPEIKKED